VTTERVVSLVPSATETLLALGADVVACTRFCEQPSLRHVGGTKNPDVAAIVALAPDVVVVDVEENRREDAAALEAAGVELLVTDVRDLAGAADAVARAAAWPAPAPPHASVTAFVPIWRRPWMTINADTYGASLLAVLGVELVTATAPERYPTVELGDVGRPDVVLVPSEPYAFSAAHVAELAAAFPAARVIRVDGQDLFWWGVRTPGAVARLRAVIGATEGISPGPSSS
jgi:ABC-type hemin transport system substrate-binding protein